MNGIRALGYGAAGGMFFNALINGIAHRFDVCALDMIAVALFLLVAQTDRK